jgi:hypothetical protein
MVKLSLDGDLGEQQGNISTKFHIKFRLQFIFPAQIPSELNLWNVGLAHCLAVFSYLLELMIVGGG